MELRQLRYFVAAAEELHFSRAAMRLNLAQSAVSSQIRQLERELGGPLFLRTSRRVELTAAGKALLDDGREILEAVDGAVGRASALARGDAGSLVIGSLGPAPGEMLAPLIAHFSARHPAVRLELRSLDFVDAVVGLRKHRADVAFLYLPLDEPDLVATPLLTEERVVVLPQSHRLARRRRLRPPDLAGEVFVTQSSALPQRWLDFWLLVEELGQRPAVSPHIPLNPDEWVMLIARGEGIDTAPAIVARYWAWPGIAFVPLVDAPPATLAVARRRADDAEPLIRDFTDLAVQMAASGSPSA